MIPNKSSLRLPSEKAERARRIMALRMEGKSIPEIAATLGLHRNTIMATRSWAEREGILAKAEDAALDLIESALSVYKKALSEGDTAVAKHILDGTGVLKKARESDRPPAGDSDTLEGYFRLRRTRGTHDETAEEGSPESGGPILDGTILPPAEGEAGMGQDNDQSGLSGATGAVGEPEPDGGTAQ